MERKETRKKRQEHYFNRLKEVVAKKGGKCLSEEYLDKKTKLEFQCKEGHVWRTKPHTIVKCNSWCPTCHFNSTRSNINDVIKFIESKGGKLLTKEYKNCSQKLKVECGKGHVWEVIYNSLDRGTWCPTCEDLNSRLTYEERIKGLDAISKIAENRGGKCLSSIEEYKSMNSKLLFQCRKKHKWSAFAYVIKTKTWCPICCQSISEKMFRCILEKVFNCSFPSCRPSWMKSDKMRCLQIDGYNEELKIGFEYQGKQHFKFVPYFHKNIQKFERLQFLDKTKKHILEQKNIFMFYPIYKLKKENYLNFIYSSIKNTEYEKIVNRSLNININKLYQSL